MLKKVRMMNFFNQLFNYSNMKSISVSHSKKYLLFLSLLDIGKAVIVFAAANYSFSFFLIYSSFILIYRFKNVFSLRKCLHS